MKDTDILKNLRDFKDIEPDEKWYHVNRSILLNIIDRDSVTKESFSLKKVFFGFLLVSRSILPNWKVALSSFVAIVMVGGSVFGASASIPGQALYPVKLATEKIEISLATSEVSETNIRLKHIDNRIAEINKLSSDEAQKHIESITANISENLNNVQNSLKTIEKSDSVNSNEIVKLAQLVDEKTINATKAIKGINESSVSATEIATLGNQVSQRALEVIIDKTGEESKEVIENSLNNKIQLQEERATAVTAKISEVTKADDIKEIVKSTSTDPSIEFNIDQLKKIDSSEIDKYLKLAKELISKGNYKGALIELEKAQFSLDLSYKALDAVITDGYKRDIENIEKNIKEIENKDTLKK